MKRIRMEVLPAKPNGWVVTADGAVVTKAKTQAEAILMARIHAELLVNQGQTITLKIKGRNGRIRLEFTYPRSSDPKRSKG